MIRNALFLCVVCAVVFLFYLPSYVKMQDLHDKNSAYKQRVSDLEQDNARLEEERRRLVTDPVYFEKVAREKMGIIRDDEVIYKIVDAGVKPGEVGAENSRLIVQKVDDVAVVKGKKVLVASKVEIIADASKSSVKKALVPSKTKVLPDSAAKKNAAAKKSAIVKKASKTLASKVVTGSTQ